MWFVVSTRRGKVALALSAGQSLSIQGVTEPHRVTFPRCCSTVLSAADFYREKRMSTHPFLKSMRRTESTPHTGLVINSKTAMGVETSRIRLLAENTKMHPPPGLLALPRPWYFRSWHNTCSVLSRHGGCRLCKRIDRMMHPRWGTNEETV